MTRDEIQEIYKIRELNRYLSEKFPTESFGSPATLFNAALNAGEITKEDHERAKRHYGGLWNYAGD